MTTIVYRDGILAADTMLSSGNALSGFGQKIVKARGILAGACGDSGLCQRFCDWVRTGMKGNAPDLHVPDLQGSETSAYVYMPDGMEVIFHEKRPPLRLHAPFYTHGSGGWIALGALEMGATAEEAVRVAMKRDHATGGDVMVLRH